MLRFPPVASTNWLSNSKLRFWWSVKQTPPGRNHLHRYNTSRKYSVKNLSKCFLFQLSTRMRSQSPDRHLSHSAIRACLSIQLGLWTKHIEVIEVAESCAASKEGHSRLQVWAKAFGFMCQKLRQKFTAIKKAQMWTPSCYLEDTQSQGDKPIYIYIIIYIYNYIYIYNCKYTCIQVVWYY